MASMNALASKSKVMASRNKGKASENPSQQNIGAPIHNSTPKHSKRDKIIRKWIHASAEKKINHSWFLRDKSSSKGEDHVYLYCSKVEGIARNFHVIVQLRGICLVSGIDIVYTLVKQVKTYAKFRYCFTLSNYKMNKTSTGFYTSIVNHIKTGLLGFIYFLYDYHYHDFIKHVNDVDWIIFTRSC